MSDEKGHKLGQYIPVHYHYQMLSDHNRMKNFKDAIDMKVMNNHEVVDLGSGTGALSFFAGQNGAKVTGIENNLQLVEYSNQLIRDNNISDRVSIEYGDASDWEADKAVDIVICEMLHSALLREKQIQVINSFKSKHLNKFNKIPKFIPYATLLAVQPIMMDYNFQGFFAPIPLFQDPYTTDSSQDRFTPQVYKTVVYEDYEDGIISADIKFVSEESITVNALRFITKNILSMDRLTKDSVEWFNQYLVLPIGKNIELIEGESFRVKFKYRSGDEIEELQKTLVISKLTDFIV